MAKDNDGILVQWSEQQLCRGYGDEYTPIHIMRDGGTVTLCGIRTRWFWDGGWREDETHASCKRCVAIYAKRKAKGAGDG